MNDVARIADCGVDVLAAMLERLGAFDQAERFEQLMTLCACDYRAYPKRATQDYPKAALLGIALVACASINETGLAADTLQEGRAAAIAIAFRSERWSDR